MDAVNIAAFCLLFRWQEVLGNNRFSDGVYRSWIKVGPILYHEWRRIMMTSNGNILRITGHVWDNSPVTGDFPHKGQWRRSLMFSLDCAWITGWENNHEAGDLRHHRAHYDVTVMWKYLSSALRLITVGCETVQFVVGCDRQLFAARWDLYILIKNIIWIWMPNNPDLIKNAPLPYISQYS